MFEIAYPHLAGTTPSIPSYPVNAFHGGGPLSPESVSSGLLTQSALTQQRIVTPPSFGNTHYPSYAGLSTVRPMNGGPSTAENYSNALGGTFNNLTQSMQQLIL